MSKFFLIFILSLPGIAQAKCILGNNTVAQQNIELDLTTGSTTVTLNTNFQDTFSCNATSDKMYFATPFHDYIVEIKNPETQRSVFLKLNLTGSGFPVNIGNNTVTTDDVINSRPFILEVSYVSARSADITVTNNQFSTGKASINILSTNECSNSLWSWLFCVLTGRLSDDNSYSQYFTFNIKHKPTTCRFSQSQYIISMPDITLNEIISGGATRSGTVNLELKCDSIYGVSTNPVSFKVSHGDWNDDGTILNNSVQNGAKGVGFQIFSGAGITPLKQNDILKAIPNMTSIDESYTFPITAKYVRIANNSLHHGDIQSKVVFTISYD